MSDVPREPTPYMLLQVSRFCMHRNITAAEVADLWRAMWDAAQEQAADAASS